MRCPLAPRLHPPRAAEGNRRKHRRYRQRRADRRHCKPLIEQPAAGDRPAARSDPAGGGGEAEPGGAQLRREGIGDRQPVGGGRAEQRGADQRGDEDQRPGIADELAETEEVEA